MWAENIPTVTWWCKHPIKTKKLKSGIKNKSVGKFSGMTGLSPLFCRFVSLYFIIQMSDCSQAALCSYAPLTVHQSLFWQNSLHVSRCAVSLSYVAHFISISIFSFYLWTPLYLNYFREEVVLQSQRQSAIHSEGHFNRSKAISKMHNTIKLAWNGGF